MRRLRRWLRRIGMALGILLVLLLAMTLVLVGWGHQRLTAALPRHTGTVAGIRVAAPVEILRDQWGVPHVFAASPHDAYLGLGYAMGQDRLFQLLFMRHLAQGRLAELFGAWPGGRRGGPPVRTPGVPRPAACP